MKRIIALLWVPVLLALTLTGCKPHTALPANPSEITEKDYVDFRTEAPEMDLPAAQSYLQGENIDVTTPEYRQAVYTVNDSQVTSVIHEAFALQEQTEAVTELFEGIDFQFIDGDALASETVKDQLSKLGTFAWDEEAQSYRFTFYDRTLAISAIRVERDHALNEYRKVLDLLLSDPNVTVKVLD